MQPATCSVAVALHASLPRQLVQVLAHLVLEQVQCVLQPAAPCCLAEAHEHQALLLLLLQALACLQQQQLAWLLVGAEAGVLQAKA